MQNIAIEHMLIKKLLLALGSFFIFGIQYPLQMNSLIH
ncbi:hypothetical protein DF16_orf01906 [Bacillus thuringiensis serovar kurstaki str. YBT-1520]|nr:hypothetical protein HD73_4323 [Bacillus thuringiensis serovar kurstaki str. HD73]AIM30321.1 hypothetical protein DF16_orf01906 [Bacillus thuringiensis serovar kurstaki str. YBT-1520]